MRPECLFYHILVFFGKKMLKKLILKILQIFSASFLHQFDNRLDRSMNNFFNLYSFLIPFAQLNLIESVKCIWSRDFRLNKYIELVR